MEEYEGCRECKRYGTCAKISFLRSNEPRGREAKNKREVFYQRLAKKCKNEEVSDWYE